MKLTTMPVRLVVVMCMALLSLPTVFAQEDGDVTDEELAPLRDAYTQTAATTSYKIEWTTETAQELVFTQAPDTLTLTSESDISQTATVAGEAISSVLEYSTSQEQVLNNEEPFSGDVELNAQAVVLADGVYLNLEDTPEGYRPGLTPGWQLVTENAQLPAESQISLAELVEIVNSVRLTADMATLLTPDVVTAIEVLDEDDKDGQPALGYLLTLDLEAALAAQGKDVGSLLGDATLPEALTTAILNDATYTLEVWVATADSLIREQTLTLEYAGEFAAGVVAEEAVTINMSQEQSLELSELGGTFEITAPEIESE